MDICGIMSLPYIPFLLSISYQNILANNFWQNCISTLYIRMYYEKTTIRKKVLLELL